MKRFLKSILLFINVAVVLALVLSGYGGHFNPAATSLPGIALMLFPVLLGGTLLLLLFDLFTWRRLAFVPAFAVLLCAPAVWNICPLNIGSPTAPEGYRTVSVMTYNAMQFLNYTDSVGAYGPAETIYRADADIVCIQEGRGRDVTDWPDAVGIRDSIAERYPYRAVGHGNLLLWSKFPFDTIAVRQSGDRTASFQAVRVDVGGTGLTIYNIHLQSIGLSNNDKQLYTSITRRPTAHRLETARYDLVTKLSAAMKARARQAALLREQIDSIGGAAIVVAGDFNDIEDCYAQRCIEGDNLRSVYTSVGRGPSLTYFANRFYFNIDHILYGGDIVPLSYRRPTPRTSDHYPVIATIAIPDEQ